MDEQKSIIKEFFRIMPVTFAYAMMFAALAGWLLGDRLDDFFSVLLPGNAGFSYQHIFQIFLLAAVNSLITAVVNNAKFFKKIMALWQAIITMLLCLTATVAVTAWSGWIPLTSWRIWVAFISGFVIIFVALSVIMIIKTNREEKQYNQLLSDYKKQKN